MPKIICKIAMDAVADPLVQFGAVVLKQLQRP